MVDKAYDPYMIDVDAMNRMKDGMTLGSSGLICPKRNLSIGKTCKVCDYLQSQIYSKQYPKEHPAKKWAIKKGSKASFFLNVVFPERKDEAKIFELGYKAGSQIVDGVNKKGWLDIAHPKKGMGREMMITKGKDGEFNFYTVSPDLNKADWEVKKDTLASKYNLSNIISMIQKNELNESNHIKASSMKDGETLRFRILPPWDDDAGNKEIMTVVWRHWGVSQEQIDGKEGLNWQDIEVTADESKPAIQKDITTDREQPVKEKEDSKKPRCFGNANYYDPNDPDCSPENCAFVDECIAKINK